MGFLCKLVLAICAFFVTFSATNATCPIAVVDPCNCASTRYEPISIVCDQAASLDAVLSAIGASSATIIDSLVISNTAIAHLPAFAFQQLTIKRLVLRNNDLVGIHPQAFHGGRLPSTLIELEIRHNKLGEIPQSGLPTLGALRSLVLSKNGIISLPPNAFLSYQCRTRLQRLDLSDNGFATIPVGVFNGLDSLQEISLDKNMLRAVPTDALRPLTQLEDLSLGVNQLARIDKGALQFPNLKSLSLEVNKLSRIPSEVFEGVPHLLYLYLSNNRFAEIDPQMFYYIPDLKVLAMGGNDQLTTIQDDAFQHTKQLVRLELEECSINNISQTAFQKIPNVQVIVLNHNKITKIGQKTFNNLVQLVSLDLKGNEISKVEAGAISNLPALKHIDLSSNRINGFEPNTFTNTLIQNNRRAVTRILYLYENLFICDDNLEWFRAYLRRNADLVIDAPGREPTRCWKPSELEGTELRNPNPPNYDLSKTSAPQQKSIGGDANTKSPEEPSRGGKIEKEDQDFLLGKQKPERTGSRISGMNLAALILGIILGIFLVSLILLMAVRYFAGRNRRQRKRDDDEARRFGSSLSGYPTATSSGYGGAYPSTPDMGNTGIRGGAYGIETLTYRTPQLQRPPSASYFLQRPWYWWF